MIEGTEKQTGILPTAGQWEEARNLSQTFSSSLENLAALVKAEQKRVAEINVYLDKQITELTRIADQIAPERDRSTPVLEWLRGYLAVKMSQEDSSYPYENLTNYLHNQLDRAGLGENFPRGSNLGNLVWCHAEANRFYLYLVQRHPELEPVIQAAMNYARRWRLEMEARE
jgi:hypothetical protein